MNPSANSKWFRLRRLPTWRTWLIFLAIIGLLGVWLGPKAHDWLALTKRVEGAKYVIAEGWMPDDGLGMAQQEFEDLNAKILFTTGGPIDHGFLLAEDKDYANSAARIMARAGFPAGKIYPVAAPRVQRERTAASAAALKEALDKMQIPAEDRKIQLVSYGVHARRSHSIFKRILGPDWQVGIVAVPDSAYPREQWYRHSPGAKAVIQETISMVVTTFGGE